MLGCVSIVCVLVDVALLQAFHFIQLRFVSISVHVVIVVKRVAVSALQFQRVSGLCCAQFWLQFLGVVRPSSFCGLGNGNLHLQCIICMCCRVILVFQVAAAMLHIVKLRFFVVGVAQMGRIVVVLVAFGMCAGEFWLVDFLVCKAVSTSPSRGNHG